MAENSNSDPLKSKDLNKIRPLQTTSQLKASVSTAPHSLLTNHDDNVVTGYEPLPQAPKIESAPSIPAHDANVIGHYESHVTKEEKPTTVSAERQPTSLPSTPIKTPDLASAAD